MRPRVYVTQPIAESALLRLKEIAEVEVNHDSSRILVKAKLIDAANRHAKKAKKAFRPQSERS